MTIENKFVSLSNICLAEAQALYDAQLYPGCVSRCSFAIFNAIRSLLESKDIEVKRYSNVDNLFHFHFVKTGIFPIGVKEIYCYIEKLHLQADYKPGYKLGQQTSSNALLMTRQFIDTMKNYLDVKN